MVPGQPGQAAAIRAEARVGVKIIARNEDLPAALVIRSAGIQGADGVDRILVAGSVIFTHVDDPPALRIHDPIGIAQVDGWGNGRRVLCPAPGGKRAGRQSLRNRRCPDGPGIRRRRIREHGCGR